MLVIWNQPHIFKLGQAIDPVHIVLMPGTNNVDPKLWTALKARFPDIDARVDDGDIEVPETEEGETLDVGDLIKLTIPNAIKLVKNTANETMLLEWLDVEKRPKVLKAVEDQMNALAAANSHASDGAKKEA